MTDDTIIVSLHIKIIFMPDETGKEQSKFSWQLGKFAFKVKIGDTEILFQEVSGLSSEIQEIEYRADNSKKFSTIKMPGIKKYGSVTFKKGMFKDDKALWDMYNNVKSENFERQTITISLLDDVQQAAMSWTLTNAYPLKMTLTDSKPGVNEVAVETIEVAHEGLDIIK